MAILGQENPAAATQTQLYTVPFQSKAVLQLFHVCWNGNTKPQDTLAIRVWVLPNGVSAVADQYLILSWYVIKPNQILDMFHEVELRNYDQIIVESNLGNVTFTLFGNQEYDADSLVWNLRAATAASGTLSNSAKLALLTSGGYNVNTNTCTGNCY